MTATPFLGELEALGVTLFLDGDRLGYRAPKGAMTPALLVRLAAQKAELVQVLADKIAQTRAGVEEIASAAAAEPGLTPAQKAVLETWRALAERYLAEGNPTLLELPDGLAALLERWRAGQ